MSKVMVNGLAILALSCSSLIAQVAHAKCEKQALKEIYTIYTTECGGQGKKSESCDLVESKAIKGNIRWHATCAFSGEPDYSDYADAELTLSRGNCELLKKDIKDCYSD